MQHTDRMASRRRTNATLRAVLALSLVLSALGARAQISRLGHGIIYEAEASATVSDGDTSPFWLTNNRYGIGSTRETSGYLRLKALRAAENDSLHDWRFGYGADIVVPFKHDRKFILQQLYADFQWRPLRLSIGQKERASELKNAQLSMGGLTLGQNARPVPQVRLELPDFWEVPGTRHWFAFKGHVAYGMFTDNGFQDAFHAPRSLYSHNSLYHSKALFFRIGNKERFPLRLTFGLEMAAQFGGEAWNLADRTDHLTDEAWQSHQKLGHSLKDFWHALVPGGNDVNDGDFKNAAGNQLGSWHLCLDYEDKSGWGASYYMEHYFDDHSQMFLQYAWKDMLYGIELQFPRNPVASRFVYEHLRTDDQSGPIYHDGNATLSTSIYGRDDYYCHQVYGAWQHAGFTMGNPLLISPLYNADHMLLCEDNRVRAHHFGLTGQPARDWAYRALFTHERSLGRYPAPRRNPAYGNFLLLEATYSPHQVKGLSLTAAYGQNGGQLIGRSKGGMLTVAYRGWIK